MGTLGTATKAPLTVEVEGKKYTLSPLELGDFGEVERWLEMLPYEKARRKIAALGEVVTPEIREAIIALADAQSQASSFGDAKSSQVLTTVEGTGYLLWLSLRKCHPEITREAALHLISLDSIAEWQKMLDKLSGLEKDDSERPTEKEAPA